MRMPDEVIEALKRRDESMLYHAMYDIYNIINVDAVEPFNQWKLEVKEYERNMIAKAEKRIYDNEMVF